MTWDLVLQILSLLIMVIIAGAIVLSYLDGRFMVCKHNFSIIQTTVINDVHGIYLRTEYHQMCDQCKKMRSYTLKSS